KYEFGAAEHAWFFGEIRGIWRGNYRKDPAFTTGERGGFTAIVMQESSSARRADPGKTAPDAQQKLVADLAIGIHLLFTVAVRCRRVMRRPVFDVGGQCPGQVQRLVMRLRRQRDDQVEIQPLPVLQLLEGGGLVAGNVLPELGDHGDRERIELALSHARGFD